MLDINNCICTAHSFTKVLEENQIDAKSLVIVFSVLLNLEVSIILYLSISNTIDQANLVILSINEIQEAIEIILTIKYL